MRRYPDEEVRRILTRLHGRIQYDILASVLGQLSDGRWLNSPRMEMYWRNASVVLDDNDVVLEVKKHALPYCAMSDAEILKWFGKKIKQLIKEEFGNSRQVWSRTNTKQMSDYLSHKYPSQTSVSDCYFAYDTLMGRDTDNKRYSVPEIADTAMESTFKKLIGKKVIKESINTVEDAISDWTIDVDLVDEGKRGYTKEKLRKFAEFFLPICPKWCSHCESADLNEYEEDSAPKYVPMINIDLIIFIMLLPNGTTVRVEDSYAPVTDFRNWKKAKKYIIEQLKDEGVDMTTESVNKPSRRKVIKESEGYDSADELEPFENDYVPTDELIRKEAMAQLRFEDIPYSEAKMLANDIVAMLTGQPFDSKSEFKLYVSFEIRENLRAFYESKKVDKSKPVIKEGVMKEYYTQFQEAFENWKPSNYNKVGNFGNDSEGNPSFGWLDGTVTVSLTNDCYIVVHTPLNVDENYEKEDGFTRLFEIDEIPVAKDCIEGLIEELGIEDNIKESKMKRTFKQLIKEGSFDNISWDHDAKPKTLDEVIAKLQQARKELGNLEVGVQFRDEGGEYYGYDANLYFWYDKKTNTFVL